MTSTTKPLSVVVDANVAIAICAKEPLLTANAEAKLQDYASRGAQFFVPGTFVAECLFVLCRKLHDTVLTASEHASAIQALLALMSPFNPPPSGDKSLVKRAEELRGNLNCKRSADGLYLALAEELSQGGPTELVTFDVGMRGQASAHSLSCHIELLTSS